MVVSSTGLRCCVRWWYVARVHQAAASAAALVTTVPLVRSPQPLTSSLRQGFESVARHQLLIRNIPRLARWQDVKDLCKQYGAHVRRAAAHELTSLPLTTAPPRSDGTGSVSHVKLVKSGTAIVHMATDEEAQHALGEWVTRCAADSAPRSPPQTCCVWRLCATCMRAESLDGAFAFGHTLQVQWRKHRGE